MIKEIHRHPIPQYDARGEEILKSIHKYATILGDHVANTDIHATSLITSSEIDDMFSDIVVDEDYTQDLFEDYVTKDYLDKLNYLTVIPDEYVTQDELEEYINGITQTVTNNVTKEIKSATDLDGYYDRDTIDSKFKNYALTTWVTSKLGNYYDKDTIDTMLSNIGSSSVTLTNRLTSGTRIVTINGTDIYAPTGSTSTSSGSSVSSYVTKGSLDSNYLLTLSQTNASDVSINLSALHDVLGSSTGTSTGTGSSTTYQYFSVSAYKAVQKDITTVFAPGNDYVFSYTDGKFTTYPSDWYETPELAKEAYSTTKTDCTVWISKNNLCKGSDGSETSTGWTTPVKYYNVDLIVDDAKNAAQDYYEKQINDDTSELSSTLADAQSKLNQAQSLIDQFAAGDISGFGLKQAELEDSIKTYGWNITENADGSKTVNYSDKILTPTSIISEVSETNPTEGSVGAAIQQMMHDYITNKVYDLDTYGKLKESYLKLTPAQAVLEVLSGESSDGSVVDTSTIQSSILNIVKNNIKLSILKKTENGTIVGTSFSLALNDDGTSESVLDTDNFIITGDMVANAIATNGLDINSSSAHIYKDGAALFGSGSIQFNQNGSGYVANKNIEWDKNGTLTLKGSINEQSVNYKEYSSTSTGTITIGEGGTYFINKYFTTTGEDCGTITLELDDTLSSGTTVSLIIDNDSWTESSYYSNLQNYSRLEFYDGIQTASMFEPMSNATVYSGKTVISRVNIKPSLSTSKIIANNGKYIVYNNGSYYLHNTVTWNELQTCCGYLRFIKTPAGWLLLENRCDILRTHKNTKITNLAYYNEDDKIWKQASGFNYLECEFTGNTQTAYLAVKDDYTGN